MTDRAGIQARLEALATGLRGVSAERSAHQVSWSAAGHQFAVLTDGAVELLLSGPVAAAAANTPETELSARGAGWVRFTPAALDAHAIDRLQAWFAFGARHAAESAGPAAPARERRPD